MQHLGFNIKKIRHLLLVLLILFALAPCTVKEVFLNSVNTEYAKPFNKSKTTVQVNPCTYSNNVNQQVSAVHKSKICPQTEPATLINKEFVPAYSEKSDNHYSKTFSGNSPPKYILYKRMKIDIA